jgi:hypothetical protein
MESEKLTSQDGGVVPPYPTEGIIGMTFMKRTAVTAVLLLTPVQANASYLVYEVAQDMFAALGEASGYMKSCRPDLDRSLFRRAKVLGD